MFIQGLICNFKITFILPFVLESSKSLFFIFGSFIFVNEEFERHFIIIVICYSVHLLVLALNVFEAGDVLNQPGEDRLLEENEKNQNKVSRYEEDGMD